MLIIIQLLKNLVIYCYFLLCYYIDVMYNSNIANRASVLYEVNFIGTPLSFHDRK